MKSWVKVLAVVFVAVLVCAAKCEKVESIEDIESVEVSGAGAAINFASLASIEWHLREVLTEFKSGGRVIPVDRDDLESKGFANAFTMTITADRIGGKAAPNTYGAPYTMGEGQAIKIQPLVSTMMAPLVELEGLKEHDYLQYLQGAYKWAFNKGQLLLFCKDGANAEVVLVYTPKN